MSSSSETPISIKDQVATVKANYPTLDITDADAKKFINKRARWFKGSIVVCCVYGVFALILLLIAIFSEKGKLILSGYLMPFTVTLIGGMLFIVLLLVIQITTFKPSITDTNVYDGDICPDYWTLEKLSENEINQLNGVDQKNRYLMKYRCKPSKDVYTLDTLKGNTTNVYGHTRDTSDGVKRYVSNPTALTKKDNPVTSFLFGTFAGQNGDGGTNVPFDDTDTVKGTTGKLNCDILYPNLLAMHDTVKFPDAPNSLRCAYTKQCNIPWTGVCPTVPTRNM